MINLTVSSCSSRSLGAVINKLKCNKGFYNKTYSSQYDKCVATISDYCSGVCLCGAIRSTTNQIISPTILRLWHRLHNMDTSRLTKRIFIINKWNKNVQGAHLEQRYITVIQGYTLLGVYNSVFSYHYLNYYRLQKVN